MSKKEICIQEDVILERSGVCPNCDRLQRKWDVENGAVQITKDNIVDYYEFMSDDNLFVHYGIVDYKSIFKVRSNQICEILKISTSEFFDYARKISFDKKDDFCEYVIGFMFFGVKDTLKPIKEYIAEIKASDGYKEYIFLQTISNMEKSGAIYNLSKNDIYMVPCANSDYHRTIENLLETLECLDLDCNDTYGLWKTSSTSALDKNFYYENINFKTSDIVILVRVVKDYISFRNESEIFYQPKCFLDDEYFEENDGQSFDVWSSKENCNEKCSLKNKVKLFYY